MTQKHSRSLPLSLQSRGRACVCRRPRTSLVFRRGKTEGPGVWQQGQLFSPRRPYCIPAAWGQPARRNPARSEWPAGTPDHGIDNLERRTDEYFVFTHKHHSHISLHVIPMFAAFCSTCLHDLHDLLHMRVQQVRTKLFKFQSQVSQRVKVGHSKANL